MNSDSAGDIDRSQAVPRGLNLLRGLVRKREPMERCEMCAAEIPEEHQHLLEPVKRKVVCACHACSILFSNSGETKYKRVPRRVRNLEDFRMTDARNGTA